MAISKLGSKAIVDCSVATDDIEDNSITSAKLSGSIANAKLQNSTITVNGTSVALGGSVDLASVSWQSVITADGSTSTTAVASQGYFIDTTSAVHTINLPASASAGDTIVIKDYAGTFGTNNVTIGRNGHNIQGQATDGTLSTNKASVTLVYVDVTKGWLLVDESNVSLSNSSFISATGGTVTESGDYKIHTFTGDGCFVVSVAGVGPAAVVDYLVVAGGGGGGGASGTGGTGSGGGAGGYRESSGTAGGYISSPLGACVSALTVSVTTYPVTVGAGGVGNSGTDGNTGNNSSFSTITSTGGGNGIIFQPTPRTSGSGGSGAGAVAPGAAGAGNTPPVSPPQGNPGGTGNGCAPAYGTGGGGGASVAGGNGTSTTGGPGGNGATTSISGSPTAYAGGGGGSVYSPPSTAGPGSGTGGTGGGGDAASYNTGNSGTANTGGGGGGAGSGPTGCQTQSGGAGGKGIVILRYKYQ